MLACIHSWERLLASLSKVHVTHSIDSLPHSRTLLQPTVHRGRPHEQYDRAQQYLTVTTHVATPSKSCRPIQSHRISPPIRDRSRDHPGPSLRHDLRCFRSFPPPLHTWIPQSATQATRMHQAQQTLWQREGSHSVSAGQQDPECPSGFNIHFRRAWIMPD